MNLHRVGLGNYQDALTKARESSAVVALSTSAPEEFNGRGRYWLTDEGTAGFGIDGHGDLISLFNNSLTRGLGRELVDAAVKSGARTLNCFDGFLPDYYRSLGWVEVRRESNWSPGGPDVVYMTLAALAPQDDESVEIISGLARPRTVGA